MRKNAETGQADGESTGDSVRNSQVEGCYPPLAEADQENGNEHEPQKQHDARGDPHIQLPIPLPIPAPSFA